MNLLFTTTVGLLSGVVGTGLGGLISITFHQSQNCLGWLLGFSGGLMFAVVSFDLLTTAFDLGGLLGGLLGMLCGFILILGLDYFLRKLKLVEENRHLATSLLLALGVAMHDFAEGLAVGAGFSAATSLGFGVAFVMTVHNIPEGVAIGVPMRLARVRRGKILLATILTGLPMAVGTLLGALIGRTSRGLLSASLGFAGGAMLCIVVEKMIPDAQELSRQYFATISFAIGTLAGIVLCWFS
jgi:ZIP family zinc transporter